VTITLDRPERRNAQTPETWHWLAELAREIPGSVRVVLLRAEGPSFSAGLDRSLIDDAGEAGLRALARSGAAAATAKIAAWQRAFDWTSRPDLISIAAVQGHAIGAGAQLALGADLRIAADDAQFAIAEPGLGLVPDLGGTKRLVELIGYARSVEVCLTGRRVPAAEALQWGLVSQVVPRTDLDAAATRLVDTICALDRDAAAETKALLLGARDRTQAAQESAEREAQYRCLRALAGLHSEDA
jgi:enoyl-CoA hydratase/carnithine racemase